MNAMQNWFKVRRTNRSSSRDSYSVPTSNIQESGESGQSQSGSGYRPSHGYENSQRSSSYNDYNSSRPSNGNNDAKESQRSQSDEDASSYEHVEYDSSAEGSGPPSTLMIRSTRGTDTRDSVHSDSPELIPNVTSSLSMVESRADEVTIIEGPAKRLTTQMKNLYGVEMIEKNSILNSQSETFSKGSTTNDVSTLTESIPPRPAYLTGRKWKSYQDSPASDPLPQSNSQTYDQWQSRAQSASPNLPKISTGMHVNDRITATKLSRGTRPNVYRPGLSKLVSHASSTTHGSMPFHRPIYEEEPSPSIETEASFFESLESKRRKGITSSNKYTQSSKFAHNTSTENVTYGPDYEMFSPDVRVVIHSDTRSTLDYTSNMSFPLPPIVPSLSPVPESCNQLSQVSSLPFTKTYSMKSTGPEVSSNYSLLQDDPRLYMNANNKINSKEGNEVASNSRSQGEDVRELAWQAEETPVVNKQKGQNATGSFSTYPKMLNKLNAFDTTKSNKTNIPKELLTLSKKEVSAKAKYINEANGSNNPPPFNVTRGYEQPLVVASNQRQHLNNASLPGHVVDVVVTNNQMKPPLPPQRSQRDHVIPTDQTQQNSKSDVFWKRRRNKRNVRAARNRSFSSGPVTSYSSSMIDSNESSDCTESVTEFEHARRKRNYSESYITTSIGGVPTSTISEVASSETGDSSDVSNQQSVASSNSSEPEVNLPPSSGRSQDHHNQRSFTRDRPRPTVVRVPNPESPLSMDSVLFVKSPTISKIEAGRSVPITTNMPESFAEFLSRPIISPYSDKASMKRAESYESGYYQRYDGPTRSPASKSCKSPGNQTLASIRSAIRSVGSQGWSAFTGKSKTPDKAALAREASNSGEDFYSVGSAKRHRELLLNSSSQIPSKIPNTSGVAGCLNRAGKCICSKSLFYASIFVVMVAALGYGVVDRSDYLLSLLDANKEVTVAFVGNAYLYVNDIPRLTERISGYHIHQSSVIHSGGSLAALSATGNGMYPKWISEEAAISDADREGFENYYEIYDYGMCTVTQLLKGYDGNLMYANKNGYYYDDGHNPCIVVDGYLDFLEYKTSNRTFEWDYVVLVDQTKRMAVKEARQDTIDSLVEFYAPLLKESNARPIIVDTHAFWSANTNMSGLVDVPTFQKYVYEGVDAYVYALARSLPRRQHPLVAPIGIAYLTVWEEDYDLWEKLFASDEVHSSLLGSYMFSCVLYATIFGHMPPEEYSLPASFKYFFTQSRKLVGDDLEYPTYEEAEYLRNVARRVVIQKYIPPSFR